MVIENCWSVPRLRGVARLLQYAILARAYLNRRSDESSRPFTPRSQPAWGWGYRSAVRSSRLIEDDCGRRGISREALSFNSQCPSTQPRRSVSNSLLDRTRDARYLAPTFTRADGGHSRTSREVRVVRYGRLVGRMWNCLNPVAPSMMTAASVTRPFTREIKGRVTMMSQQAGRR